MFGPFLIDFWFIFGPFFIDFSYHFKIHKTNDSTSKNKTSKQQITKRLKNKKARARWRVRSSAARWILKMFQYISMYLNIIQYILITLNMFKDNFYMLIYFNLFN